MVEKLDGYPIVDLADLPASNRGFVRAMRQLPAGKALLKPASPDQDVHSLQAGSLSNLRKAMPERRFHSRIDFEQNGVWFWCEPTISCQTDFRNTPDLPKL